MIWYAVTGGRDYVNRAHVYTVLDGINTPGGFGIVCGAAPGLDTLAIQWAKERKVPHAEFPADWSGGKAAGPQRNARMLRAMAPVALLAFPGGLGTASCIAAANQQGIAVYHYVTG